MTDTTMFPPEERTNTAQAAADRIARCQFCSTLNEYVEGGPAPLCSRCGLDLSVPSHLRPLDVTVLLAQLGHASTQEALRLPARADASQPSLLDQLIEDNSGMEEARASAQAAGHPVPLAHAQVPSEVVSPPADQVMSPASVIDVAEMTVAVVSEPEGLDSTVMVSRSSETNCVLVLPDDSEYPLFTDTVVGRRPEASPHVQTLALPDPTRTLSRTHARIWYDGTSWCVEDLGSVNGVSIISEDNREIVLEPGVATRLESPRFKLGTLDVSLAVPTT